MSVDDLPSELIRMLLEHLPIYRRTGVARVCRLWTLLYKSFPTFDSDELELIIPLRKREVISSKTANSTLIYAASKGHMRLCGLAARCGATHFNNAMAAAAKHEHFDIVKWCHKHGADDFEEAIYNAAEVGNLAILSWCAVLGTVDFETVWWQAVMGEYLDILDWCVDFGMDDFNTALVDAAERGKTKVALWCLDHGATKIDEAMRVADNFYDEELVELLRARLQHRTK